MEGDTIVNGSHEIETDPSEKILKTKKSKNTSVDVKEQNSVIQNGSDVTENNDMENGHIEDTSKQNGNENLIEENVEELKESTPRKLRRESRKESSPKPETPMKRELRRRETTPRTPKKIVATMFDNPPEEKQNEESKPEKKDEEIYKEKHNLDDGKIKSKESDLGDESVIILEETREEVISINESVEAKESEILETEESASNFSVFTKGYYKSNLSSNIKDSSEASSSSPSVVCLDSPIVNNISPPSNEIKGRKPINSLSKFPGRTVSIVSLDRSLKRKADDSFDNDSEKKKFAGDIESGSEKSPGWNFFSSSWSPVQAAKQPHSSTPFFKRVDQDSMAVNFDENTNISIACSEVKDPEEKTRKWCSIM